MERVSPTFQFVCFFVAVSLFSSFMGTILDSFWLGLLAGIVFCFTLVSILAGLSNIEAQLRENGRKG